MLTSVDLKFGPPLVGGTAHCGYQPCTTQPAHCWRRCCVQVERPNVGFIGFFLSQIVFITCCWVAFLYGTGAVEIGTDSDPLPDPAHKGAAAAALVLVPMIVANVYSGGGSSKQN